jgi:hypothetical protein
MRKIMGANENEEDLSDLPPDAVEFVQAYCSIKDPRRRRALLELTKDVALNGGEIDSII